MGAEHLEDISSSNGGSRPSPDPCTWQVWTVVCDAALWDEGMHRWAPAAAFLTLSAASHVAFGMLRGRGRRWTRQTWLVKDEVAGVLLG